MITGASQGLGKAIAFELAKRNIPLILTSLPNEGIEQTAAALKSTGIEVHFYETDLSQKENVLQLASWVNERFDLQILVNNAGRGGTKPFLEAGVAYLDSILQLNVTAGALLTHQLLPNLLKQEKAFILNVSSIAAFSPIGYKTVYPASKKFIQHFSEGLREELSGTGVCVSVVYPGPMATNEDTRNRLERQGRWAKAGLLPVEKIAEIAVKGMLKKKKRILPGKAVWWARWLLAFMPGAWALRLLTRAVFKEITFLTTPVKNSPAPPPEN